jgi:uncharacterized protein YegL
MSENPEQYAFSGESPDNYEQKCLCVLVLDVSSSMNGKPLEELNQGLKDFQREVQDDFVAAQRIEVAIVAFGSRADLIQEPALTSNFEMPLLRTSGSTKLVDGVRLAINVAEERKEWYKSTGQTYYRPWIMLISDGEPDKDQDVLGLSEEIETKVNNKGFLFYAVGVEGYNHEKLAEVSHSNTPPLPLKGLAFTELFKWLSASIAMVSKSAEGQMLSLPSPAGWAQIQV